MLASIPANTLNQNQTDSRILNRFSLTESRSKGKAASRTTEFFLYTDHVISPRSQGLKLPITGPARLHSDRLVAAGAIANANACVLMLRLKEPAQNLHFVACLICGQPRSHAHH